MSLVSILKNADSIREEKIKLKQLTSGLDDASVIQYIISRCLEQQYKIMRTKYNQNMINKRHFDKNLSGYALIDALYQHIFSHNYIAYNDELFEVWDALKERNTSTEYHTNPEKKLLIDGLVIEEVIDVFHFLLEYIILLEEFSCIMLMNDVDVINVLHLDSIYVDCNNSLIYNNTTEMLNKESAHLASEIIETDNRIKANDSSLIPSNFTEFVNTNRQFIRNTNFKDWKEYDIKAYYNHAQISKLFYITRNMVKDFVVMMKEHTQYFNMIDDERVKNENSDSIVDAVICLGAIYNAKLAENYRRQESDPRYKLNATGEIVGDVVTK